jgi:hypothetical protein
MKSGMFVGRGRETVKDALSFTLWSREQRRKQRFACRTLEDMSEEEIAALETLYKCPVKRPERKRSVMQNLTFVAVKADAGEGFIGKCVEVPGPMIWGETQADALTAIQSTILPIEAC